MTTRVTTYTYDWRGRRVATDGEVDFYQETAYDNLDRPTVTQRRDTTSGGNLVAKRETKYDARGRVYQTVRYGVNPATGAVGQSLTDNTWYDASGNVLKQQPAGARLFTKQVYDGLGGRPRAFRATIWLNPVTRMRRPCPWPGIRSSSKRRSRTTRRRTQLKIP